MRPALAAFLVPALLAQAPDPRWSELDAHLKAEAAADRFAGVVLVARGGRPLFQGAYGLAHRGYGVPNRMDTKFNMASMGKMFTAVAIAQLAEQGRLDFQDPILKHLPEYRGRKGWEKVRIHHLLCHTAGFGNYWNEAFDRGRGRIRAVKDYFPTFEDEPLAFEPGTQWAYSNVGFIILGRIVEKASGEDYFDYVQKHVLDPAGMRDTGYYELDRDTPGLAAGYTRMGFGTMDPRPGPRRNNLLEQVVKGGPAGGGYTTAGDMLAFAEALTAHRLCGSAMVEALFRSRVEAGDPPSGLTKYSYGYGFELELRDGRRSLGHGGGFPGSAGKLAIYPDSDLTVVALANVDPEDLGPVMARVRAALPR